jgi:hypothetical protein
MKSAISAKKSERKAPIPANLGEVIKPASGCGWNCLRCIGYTALTGVLPSAEKKVL